MTTSSTQRGYGHNHQTRRQQLLYNLEDGTPCDICGQPMHRNPKNNPDKAPLEADHRQGDKTQLAYRLLHRRCNRSIANHWQEHGPGWYTHQGTNPTGTEGLDWPKGRIITWPA